MSTEAPAAPSPYNTNNPFLARITENSPLNKAGSEKEPRHFVVDLRGSGIAYQPGYSIGIFASNTKAAVTELLAKVGLTPASPAKDATGKDVDLLDTLQKNFTL